MADLLGSMRVEIIGDNSKLDKSIDASEKKTKEYGDSSEKLAKSLKTLFSGIAFAAVAKKIFDITKEASALAASGEEIRSKFNAVFKDGAADVQAWAEEYATSVGRSDTQTLSFLATLQDTFVPMGIARDTASEFSKTMVELSGDLGSFNDVAQADVIKDLQSALVGNHETMRKYGVVINETTLLQEAMNSGLVNSKAEMTEEIKIRARMNLIIAGTQDAQGDLLRTQESTTNVNAALNSQLEKLLESYGSAVNKGILPFKKNLLDEITTINKNIKAHILRKKAVEGNATLIEELTLAEIEQEKAEKALAQAKANITAAENQVLTAQQARFINSERFEAQKAQAIERAKETVQQLENELIATEYATLAAKKNLDTENARIDANIKLAQGLEDRNELIEENTALQEDNIDTNKIALTDDQKAADERLSMLIKSENAIKERGLRIAAFEAEQAALKLEAEKERTAIEIELEEEKRAARQTTFDMIGSGLKAIDSLSTALASAELKRLEDSGASEEELDEKKKKLAKEAATRDRLLALFDITIATAAGIAKAIPNWPLVIAAGAVGTVQTAAVLATPVPSFAQGGIVAGNDFVGDNVPAFVNSGEMILNRNQQARLFELANSGGTTNNTSNNSVNINSMFSLGNDAKLNEAAERLFTPLQRVSTRRNASIGGI